MTKLRTTILKYFYIIPSNCSHRANKIKADCVKIGWKQSIKVQNCKPLSFTRSLCPWRSVRAPIKYPGFGHSIIWDTCFTTNQDCPTTRYKNLFYGYDYLKEKSHSLQIWLRMVFQLPYPYCFAGMLFTVTFKLLLNWPRCKLGHHWAVRCLILTRRTYLALFWAKHPPLNKGESHPLCH